MSTDDHSPTVAGSSSDIALVGGSTQAGAPSRSLWQTLGEALTEAWSVLAVRLDQARSKYQLGSYDAALVLLEEVVARLEQRALKGTDPAHRQLLRASAFAMLGRIYHDKGEPDKAREWLERGTAIFASLTSSAEKRAGQYQADYGISLLLLGRKEQARVILKKAVADGNTSPDVARHLGLLLVEQGHPQEAEHLLREAVESALDDIDLRIALAHTLEALGRNTDAASMYRETAYACDDLAKARHLFERSLGLDPDDVTALWALGQIASVTGDRAGALARFDRALEIDDTHVPSLIRKASLMETSDGGDQNEALKLLDRALKREPENVDAWVEKGVVYTRQGNYAQAIEALERARGLDPEDLEALLHLAEAYRLADCTTDALTTLDFVLERDPDDARALGTKGQILLSLGDAGQAVELLEYAVRLMPAMGWAWRGLGEALWSMKRPEEALKALDRALEIVPADPMTLFRKAGLLLDLNQAESAVRILDPLAPEHPWADPLLARALHVAERWEEALQAFERVLDQDPHNSWVLGMKAHFHCDIGEFQTAEELARKATEENPEPWVFGILGWTLENLQVGRAVEAEWAYRRALELDEANPRPWDRKGLGNALRLQGCMEEARKEYGEVLLQANDGDFDLYRHELLGWCHYGMGQYEEAIRLYLAALSSNRMMVGTHFDLALALLCSGRYGMAADEYEKALSLAKRKHPWRRRGLLHVALGDLREAISNPEIPHASEQEPEVLGAINQLEESLGKLELSLLASVHENETPMATV